MPPITSNKEELDGLHTLVDSSVVVLIRSKDGTDVDFATGFVIFVNRSMALICVDRYLIKNDESLAVRFHDNTRQTAHVFFQKSISRHAILEVRSDTCRHLRPVTFSESEMTRQDLFTVAAVHKEGRLGLMTGTVGNPSCEAITLRGDPIYRSEGTFAFTCPVPGRSRIPNVREMHWEEPEELGRIIGAAVFDMHGLVIGTVVTTDPCSDGTKFAIKSSFFLDQLESNLKLKDKKISLLRHGRGLGQGSRMSRHHDTTAEAASRKRGRANIPRGGTGTGKSVRLTHLEGTVEVVCKKQPRLHKHPVQGDMDGVRRKAVQGDMDGVRRKSFEQALMRLVTLESDDARRSSSCPSDATIKSKKCMKVFIARNPGDVGSDNSIAVEPFDLNQFFCGDDKHYDNTLKNGTADQVEKIIKILNEGQIASTDVIEVVVSSPYVFLPTVKDKLRPENQVAAKNCCVKKGGAFSGEVSAEMLANLGIHWVILGHFERRSLFGESSEFVGDKVASALSQGLEVIACVGETLEQRGAGSTMAVVVEQTKAIAEKIKDWTNVVIAYEPVWAIGTGKVATPAHAQEVHANLRDWLKTNVSPEVAKSTKIVYAGSVIGANANELASQPDIDGFLVSGASLKVKK